MLNLQKLLIACFLCFSITSVNAQNRAIQRIESIQSLFIEIYDGNDNIGSATGFLIKPNDTYYLVTNWHVLTNMNPSTQKPIDLKSYRKPTTLKIHHNSVILGEHAITEEKICSNSGDINYEEWRNGELIADVVALPLKDTIGIALYPINYRQTYDSLKLKPLDVISVVGFPRDIKGGNEFPIWKSGYLASEPVINQEGKPLLWVDLMGFHGMSGSPVYHITSQIVSPKGDIVQLPGSYTYFLGVYSHGVSNVGIGGVWKSTFLVNWFDSLN